MIIRRAVPHDHFAICEISRNDMGYECSSDLVLYRLSNLDCEREAIFVAEIDKNIVGYIHAETYNVLYFESMVNVLGIAVSSKYRRQGVGKALFNEVERWANSLNIKKDKVKFRSCTNRGTLILQGDGIQ